MANNVTKMVKVELLNYARELGHMFIRNNWIRLRDAAGDPASTENWGLEFDNCEGDKEKFIYRSPRKEDVPVKDFVLTFDLVVGDYEKLDLQGEASLGEATAIMKGILEFAHTLPKEKEHMTGKSFDEEVAEHRKNEITKLNNCIADMSLEDVVAWLGSYWGRKPGDGQGNFAIVTSRNTTTFHDGDLDHARETILAHLSRLGKRDGSEPNPHKESQMLAILKGMSDKDLAIWFRNFEFNVGENYLVLRNGPGNMLNFGVPYWPAFGREVAARLETQRVTEDMLVIDLGKERPVNPLTAVKRFTNALEKVIQEGPEEPELRAYGTERQIAQGWIDWYRKTHACGFDVAWTEGARRLIEKEYANRPDELKKITWYPRPHNPLFIEIGTKLEFIQP